MTDAQIEQTLLRFIVGELIEDRYDGRDPLATGAVDSLGLEMLLDFVEEEFGVAVAEEEIASEDLESVARLATLIGSRRDWLDHDGA